MLLIPLEESPDMEFCGSSSASRTRALSHASAYPHMGRSLPNDRDSISSTSSAPAMAVGDRGSSSSSASSEGSLAMLSRPHSRSAVDTRASSSSSSASSFAYLRRAASRSLTDELSTASSYSDESVDGARDRNSLPERFAASSVDAATPVRHGTDPHVNDRYYATLLESGKFVKKDWLTKQGHVWKNWKSRYFVLFHDGTFAYYKNNGKRRMKGCIKLNEGVVSIQHVDIRRSSRPYVFQVEKGFYRMLCCCSSQQEAELWVRALRSVRQAPPPCFEPLLTAQEDRGGYKAINDQLNKIFVTDARIRSMLSAFKASIVTQSITSVYDFILRLEDAILDRHQGYLFAYFEYQLVSGNELVKILRRHVEDRAFIPAAANIYSSMDSARVRSARHRITKNMKILKTKEPRELGVPEDIADISQQWSDARAIVDSLDCMSLPAYKIEHIVKAGNCILSRIKKRQGSLSEVADSTLTAIFRVIVVHSALDDPALLHGLLKPIYQQHPSCQNQDHVVAAFIDAIAWIDAYQRDSEDGSNGPPDSVSLAAARVVVSISTVDIGILFTTDGNGRGAVVSSVRKLSQAALSETILPGLSLIAINDEPVILMPFRDVCQRLRTAALPKKLTFLPEFFYYQLLSLDNDMYQYLMCLAASRGDKDSVAIFVNGGVYFNELCSWERTRGYQVLGFKPATLSTSALHAATLNGHFAVVEYLLGIGADPNLEDGLGRTPLHVLSTMTLDMVPIIEELKNANAKLNARDHDGVTPLMEMARRGSLEGVTTLLALGAELGAVAWSTGFTALDYAIEKDAIRVVELLLSKGANPNSPALDGGTSLHLAAARGNAAVVRLLIDAGADVNQQNRYGQTPAAVLLAQSNDEVSVDAKKSCLDALARAGCEIHKPDLLGRHLLHLAQLSDDLSIYQLMHSFMKPGRSDCDQLADIFGCTAHDYSLDVVTSDDLAHVRAPDPQSLWSPASANHAPSSFNRQKWHAHSKSFDEMMDNLVQDVSVDLADLVAFAMFLESFASIDAVLNNLREYVSNGSSGRNLLRFAVVLVLFKLRHSKENDSHMTEIRLLIERHQRRVSQNAIVVMEEYADMFAQYFSLRGSPTCLDNYASLPTSMQERYGGDQPPAFTTVFPRNIFIQVSPSQWAEHCTLLTHTLFCSIPVEDFISIDPKAAHSNQYLSAKRWFQHLSAYVINAVLTEDTRDGRVEVINFFLAAAESCLSLRNYDSLAAILYALQSTAVQRLRRTLEQLPDDSKKLLNKMQCLSDKGCREVNKIMRAATSPSMPYIGLYLQNFVGLNELPVFEKGNLVNASRLRKLGELAVEILHRRSSAYHIAFDADVDTILHVQLPYATDESRYQRSLQLEPREAGAAPLGDRSSYVITEDLDLDSEVRESIGGEGTFGIRQWFRMQKVVHRNRSRSTTQAPCYEWV